MLLLLELLNLWHAIDISSNTTVDINEHSHNIIDYKAHLILSRIINLR